MPRAAIFFHITVRLIYLIREKEKGEGKEKGKGQGNGDRDVAGQGFLPVATRNINRLYLNFLVIFTS